MRDCPVCGSSSRIVVDPDYMNFELYKCVCGMHYVDHISLSQEWFDRYYMTVYKTDDKPYSDKRLNSLASFVASYDPRNVLDIGGMDGELQSRIASFGIPCDVSGVENGNQKTYDIVVISHTLEHIYNVSSMFQRILGNLGNRLIIEVPEWWNYEDLTYDHHWQHINKFTAYHQQAYPAGFLHLVTYPGLSLSTLPISSGLHHRT